MAISICYCVGALCDRRSRRTTLHPHQATVACEGSVSASRRLPQPGTRAVAAVLVGEIALKHQDLLAVRVLVAPQAMPVANRFIVRPVTRRLGHSST